MSKFSIELSSNSTNSISLSMAYRIVEKEANERNDNYSKMTFSNGKRPYRAMSLDDAIWEIKDYERDNTELRCRDENYDY